jgi:hypothetical protein
MRHRSRDRGRKQLSVRAEASRGPEREPERAVAVNSGTQFVSPTGADDEQGAGVLPDADGDEDEDEDLDGAVLIEKSDEEERGVREVHRKKED